MMADQQTNTSVPAEHGNFPPFDKQTFPSQILWLTLVFVAIYVLMSRIALPRIDSIMAARRQRIDGDLGEAKRLKDESDQAIAGYEKALADARGRAQSVVADARTAQAAQAEAQRKELDAKLNGRIGEAEKGIANSKSAAIANVRGIATDAAAAIVERLVGVKPGPGSVAAAVADALKR
jgi:F-type H+-transporting ATPase subunit b